MKLYLATVLEFTYAEQWESYAHNRICATADDAQTFIDSKVAKLKAEFEDVFEVPWGSEGLQCGNRYSVRIEPQEVKGVVPEKELLQEQTDHLRDLIEGSFSSGDVADVHIRWKDTGEDGRRFIAIKPMEEMMKLSMGCLDDDKIFFYCEDIEALKELCSPDNGEDFYIIAFERFDDWWNL